MENKLVISANKIDSSEYVAWFEELKSRYCSSQLKAGLSVNRELLQFNWNLGKDIVEKKSGRKIGKRNNRAFKFGFKKCFSNTKRIFHYKPLVYEKVVSVLY